MIGAGAEGRVARCRCPTNVLVACYVCLIQKERDSAVAEIAALKFVPHLPPPVCALPSPHVNVLPPVCLVQDQHRQAAGCSRGHAVGAAGPEAPA